MPKVVQANMRNGQLFAFINGQEVAIELPPEYPSKMSWYKKPADASASDDADDGRPKTEAHCRLRWESNPSLREMFGVGATVTAGSPLYEANFKRYARRVLGDRAVGFAVEDEKVISDAAFEAACAERFAETTEAGEPRYRMFGVKTSDTSSPEYQAGLKRFTAVEREWKADGTRNTPSQQFKDPGGLDAALERAEKDAIDRFRTDPRLRAQWGVESPFTTPEDSGQYQASLKRYVAAERKWVQDNFTPPAVEK